MTIVSKKPDAWVYIAGPYTLPCKVEGVRNAAAAWATLHAALGDRCLILCPHWSFTQDLLDPGPLTHQQWLDHDLMLLESLRATPTFGVICRIPGASAGADDECAWARKNRVPVIGGIVKTIEAIRKELA